MKSSTKIIIIIELIFIVGVLAYVFFSYPKQISPTSGMTIKENFNFEFENAKTVLISTNKNFTSTITLKRGEKIELPPGVYYWKAKGWFKESEIRNFTIPSKIVLNMQEKNESYVLENKGNVELNITKRNFTDKGKITGHFILEIEKEIEIEKENNTIIEGGQK